MEEKDNRKLGDKIEDTMEEVVGSVEDVIYGPNPGMDKIPATMETSKGYRKVVKHQTRKNISRKVMKSGFGKVLIIIFVVGILMLLIYKVLNYLLLK